jgi:glutamate synthase (NADPH/NADH) small chain
MCGGSVTASPHHERHPEIARRFPELHPPLDRQSAVVEANRCLNCFDAPCMGACPTHIDVPAFIKKISTANLRGSALTILEANVLALSCSRVCPVEVLCEGACVMHHQGQAPIKIGRLQRHAMDAFHHSGGKLPRREIATRPGRIVCIGAGPASLAAAAELAQRGHAVTVMDKRPLPGGLNTYGVAEYKLTAEDSLREIALIEELGVHFEFGAAIESEAALAALEQGYDAIFLGVGLGAMHALPIPGGDHPAVIDALRFIEDYKLGITTSMIGTVIVIGAGNTAVDAAIAARRLGAEHVSILYRRTEPHISAFDFEYRHAVAEGVQFHWLTQPVAIDVRPDRLTRPGMSLECVRLEIGADGSLDVVPDSEFSLACDLVIPAIGQAPLATFLSSCRGVALENGRIVIDRLTGQTTHPKYFAGGDCTNGGREVVDAVADGKRAAVAMATMLEAAYA